jgi:hypothetical protein
MLCILVLSVAWHLHLLVSSLAYSSILKMEEIYAGYPVSKFRLAIAKKKEFVSKPFILTFDVRFLHYFSI